jgi:ABC-type multidrug transport system fused ATPase/permease subunit
MNNFKLAKSFFVGLINRFKFRFYLLVFFGVLNSFLQGLSIVLIIPLLETLEKKNTNNFFMDFLHQMGWKDTLNFLLLYYLIILVLYASFRWVYNYYSAKFVSIFSKEYANKTFIKISRARWDFHVLFENSYLTNLFNNEYYNLRNVTLQSFRIIQSALIIIIQLWMSIVISWQITLLTLFALGIIYFIQKRLIGLNYKYGVERVNVSHAIQHFLSETFAAIKLLKIHRLEETRNAKYNDVQEDLYQNEMKIANLDSLIDFLFLLSSALVIVGIIYFNFSFHILKLGGLLVVLMLLSRTISQAQVFVKYISTFMNSLPSYAHFKNTITKAEELELTNLNNSNKLVLNSLYFKDVSYSIENKIIIDTLDFNFSKGKLYLLFGPSGRGKTTTLDLVAGLIQPTHGAIYVNDDSTLPLNSIQHAISYVLQDTILFQGSIIENITIGGNYSNEEVLDVIEKTGLSTLVQTLPNGIDTIINEGATMLSGGEKQRIAIARALIRNADLILLDEITSSLDVHNETAIMEVISTIKSDKIIIMVGHRERLKDYADEVIYY